MTEPISFTSATPRHALPYLFAGQAQREFFVNESLARIDLLLHPSVEGERADPPADPVAGECWIVGQSATGAWQGHDGQLAAWQGGQWLLAAPARDMRVHDRTSGGLLRFDGQWLRIARPADPAGGATIDAEARAAIVAILDALEQYGIFSAG